MAGVRELFALAPAAGHAAEQVGRPTQLGGEGTELAPESQAEHAEQRSSGEHKNGPDQHPHHGYEGIGS